MNWVDVCGAPGSGKSTLCDPLWGPYSFMPYNKNPPPEEWQDFLNEVTRLFGLIQDHKSFISAVRMNRRTFKKMNCVVQTNSYPYIHPELPYIQAGFVQRGLGFGWRMVDMGIDIDELRYFFRLMPVSIGVAMLSVPEAENIKRNKARESVPETAHENRSFMLPLMKPAFDLALEIFNERGVPVTEIDTSEPIEQSRDILVQFANQEPDNTPPLGPRREVPVLSVPVWW